MQEFLIANIKLQAQKLWHVLYSMYLDKLAAVALVVISVSVIKTCICCSSHESSECTGKHRQFLGPFTTNKHRFS